MRLRATLGIAALALQALAIGPSDGRAHRALLTAVPNDNRAAAGTLRDGVLTVSLEARLATWHPDGDSLPGIPVEAFAEVGRAPQVPGPLIRVREGTEIRATVRNALARDTLTFHLPGGRGPEATDSVVIPPGETREIRTVAPPGAHLYRAATSARIGRQLGLGGLLAGAIVVDSAGAPPAVRDRVFVLQEAADSVDAFTGFPVPERSVFAINGRSWPHTERLTATVGDTARWHVVNASKNAHPMHLHGFYFRVDAFAGPLVARQGQGPLPRMVVTERMTEFATLSMTWVPERAGNWLFHCHFQEHVVPHGRLAVGDSADGGWDVVPSAGRAAHAAHAAHGNHATTGMGGLVLGVAVRPRPGERIAEPGRGRRRLRLLAVAEPGFPDSAPLMRFTLGEPAPAGGSRGTAPASSTLHLTRGEPVSITVVNRLREPTTVHWHGIELESYHDGVAGFGGYGRRLTPLIAPGDSFEARFTPPRAGTFMYHSHVNEPRQHRAGLAGPLIVRDRSRPDPAEDVVLLLKAARAGPRAPVVLEVNGRSDPDTTVLRAGRRYRLRLISIAVGNPAATVWITARRDSAFQRPRDDTLLVRWRPLAKDGADLPERERTPRLARQVIGMGETYDFELVPERRGDLRVEVRAAILRERLFVRVPIRVE